MTNKHTHPYQSAAGWSLLALALPLLWWVSHPARQIVIEPMMFVFWHTAVEVFAVVVAMLIFVTGYRAILSTRKGAVVLLGVAFLGVGLLDFLHAMSYVGMPDAVTANSAQKSIFFWLTARMLAAGALLVYALLPPVPDVTNLRKRLALALMLAVVGVLGLVGLLWPDRVPALFIEGQGLTPLKVSLEWLIVAINLATMGCYGDAARNWSMNVSWPWPLPRPCQRSPNCLSRCWGSSTKMGPMCLGIFTRWLPICICSMPPSTSLCAALWNGWRCSTCARK